MRETAGGINNISRFLVPFYLKKGKKNEMKLFCNENWEKFYFDSRYLTGYIREIYRNSEVDICHSYRLKENGRNSFGLPVEDEMISLDSRILTGRSDESHLFSIKEILSVCYATGIGFLVLTIEHGKENTFKEIVDKCFAISNIFGGEHDNSGRESTVNFYRVFGDIRQEISLKNSIYKLLQVDELRDNIEIFPSNSRKRLNGYHRIYLENKTDEDERLVAFLGKGLHSDFLSSIETDSDDSDRIRHVATQNTMWEVCSNGVVFLSYADATNEEYLKNILPVNIDNDYFLLYLYGLHERENLFRYKYLVVKEWNNPQKLLQLKDDLMQFSVWSGYGAVSTETGYQSFYDKLGKALAIEKLEKDVEDIVSKLNDSFTSRKERKVNALLSAIAILAVFSVFADGIALVDRVVYSQDAFNVIHYVILGLISLVIGVGVVGFIRRK